MGIEVVLRPLNESEFSGRLANLYDPKNASYKHQLSKGKFYARFAPASEQSTAISDYLQESGLHGLRLFL